MIRNLVHNIWIQGFNNLPEKEYINLQNFKKLNPNYTFMFWDETKIKHLLQEFPEILYVYEKLEKSNEFTFPWRSDIARYVIMFKYGGIYCDLDFECIASFDKIFVDNKKSDIYVVDNQNAFLKKISFNLFHTPKYGAYFMAFSKNHPVWLQVFKRIINASSKRDIGEALDRELQQTKYKIVIIKNKILGHYQCGNKDSICSTPVVSSWNPIRPILKTLNCMNYTHVLLFILCIIIFFVFFICKPHKNKK